MANSIWVGGGGSTGNPTVPVLANGLSNTAVTISSGAGVMTSYFVYNPNASVAYVQFYDTAGAVSVGSTTPVWSIGIPATSGANVASLRLSFANAIKVAATTTATGGSAPVTALDANVGYEAP
jgi:hypothetical protein